MGCTFIVCKEQLPECIQMVCGSRSFPPSFLLGLQMPRPATEPRNPETPKPQKCILKSKQCHFGPPRKMAPKSIIKCPKSLFWGVKMSQNGLFGHFIWGFGAIFSGGSKWQTLKCTFGVSGFRGSVAGRGVCNARCKALSRRVGGRCLFSQQEDDVPARRLWACLPAYSVKSKRGRREGDGLSGPVLRDTARLSQRYPPIARYGVFGVSTWPIGCDTPPPFSQRFPLGQHAKWRCDTPPPQKGYLSDTRVIPYENKANGCNTPLCDTIWKGYCVIWGGISH